MAQIKGQTGNPNGRPKGLQTKTTKQTKELIVAFMVKNFNEVQREWKKLQGVDKVRTYVSLVKCVMPPPSPVKVDESDEDDIIQQILDNQK